MQTDHLSFFELEKPPFTKEIDDGQLWLPPSKSGVVDRICRAVLDRNSVSLVGDPGVGKTCVLRAVRCRLEAEPVRLTYCHNATLGRRDFYRQLCLALGLSAKATVGSLFWAVSTHVEQLAKESLHPVLLLDESHLLHQDTLDHLHILLNYQWDSRALLSLILVGLPELEDRLKLRRNRALYSRIYVREHIEPLTPADTHAYIDTRMEVAGATRPLFARDAVSMLHEATLGTMRDIDRLASLCLDEAVRQNRQLIERDILQRVLERGKSHQEVLP